MEAKPITVRAISAEAFYTAYGRQHELQQIEAQTIQAVMEDRTGLFSPWNFTSPWTNLLAYNDSVMVYNTQREVFPTSIIAGMFHFDEAHLFEVEQPTEREAPKVSFT